MSSPFLNAEKAQKEIARLKILLGQLEVYSAQVDLINVLNKAAGLKSEDGDTRMQPAEYRAIITKL